MAPADFTLVSRRALQVAGTSTAVYLARRDLSVNSTQKVTLGIIALYVVVIALLWNIPYVRQVLWPFKVRARSLLPSSPDPATN
jgi:hypothetical protein